MHWSAKIGSTAAVFAVVTVSYQAATDTHPNRFDVQQSIVAGGTVAPPTIDKHIKPSTGVIWPTRPGPTIYTMPAPPERRGNVG